MPLYNHPQLSVARTVSMTKYEPVKSRVFSQAGGRMGKLRDLKHEKGSWTITDFRGGEGHLPGSESTFLRAMRDQKPGRKQ